jgi:uncharacterized protein (DUF488 family)
MTKNTERYGSQDVTALESSPSLIYSLGHGDLPLDLFLELLRHYGIGRVVDVRMASSSRHNPQFDKKILSPFLRIRRIKYLHMKELGGLRRRPGADSPNTGWRNASLRGFADYMMTPPFAAALNRLIQLASDRTTALLCSETEPWRCHRLLIADALAVRGMDVIHIISLSKAVPHCISVTAKVHGTEITYPDAGTAADAGETEAPPIVSESS